VDGGDGYDRQIEHRLEKVEERVDSLMAWRSWIVGLVAGVGLLTGAFAKQIGIVLGQLFR